MNSNARCQFFKEPVAKFEQRIIRTRRQKFISYWCFVDSSATNHHGCR